MKIECYFDGCCEPKNPGGAMGIGAIVIVDSETKLSYNGFVPLSPNNTNNIAEYLALEKIIDYLLENKLDGNQITICGDSQLAIRQMTGEYGMNSGAYIPYARRCLTKIASFNKIPKFQWIPREQNEEADKLSKGELSKNGITVATHSDDPSVLTFGKYKGKSVNDIEDMQYLKWVLDKVKIKDKFRTIIEKRISSFEYLAK